MYKTAVILGHVLIIIFATIVGLGGVFNPSSPDPDRTYGVWFTATILFNILVIVSCIIQVRYKRLWVFMFSLLAFVIFLVYFLPHIVMFIEGL